MRPRFPSHPTAAALAVHYMLNPSSMHPIQIEENSSVEAANDDICDARAQEGGAEATSMGDMWRPLLPPAIAGVMPDGADVPDAPSDVGRKVRSAITSRDRAVRHEEQETRKNKVRVRSTRSTRLVAARKLNGWDQEEAARRLGYANSSQLCKMESGSHEINIDHIANAAEVYGVSGGFLMGLESAEHELDIRARIGRRIEERLSMVAKAITDSVDAEFRAAGGATASTVRSLTGHAKAVVGAFHRMDAIALNEIKGGETLGFAVEELETAVLEAMKVLAGYEAEMEHLRHLLRATPANDE